MADTNVNLSVSDPASADIQAVCQALTAACNFFCTPEGQKLAEQWRIDGVAFRAAVQGAWIGVTNLLKGKL